MTAIDMRCRLGMPQREPEDRSMSVIVEHGGELYALVVDDVGDVLWLEPSDHEAGPATLSPQWRAVCSGLYRLEDDLLLVLNIDQVLTLTAPASLVA